MRHLIYEKKNTSIYIYVRIYTENQDTNCKMPPKQNVAKQKGNKLFCRLEWHAKSNKNDNNNGNIVRRHAKRGGTVAAAKIIIKSTNRF